MDNIFVGFDVTKVPCKILDEKESELCKYMTEQEIKAYHYGINTFTSILQWLLQPEENEIFVHIPNVEILEEFVYEDLLEKFNLKGD